jgi:hypothetical protein
LTVDDSGFSPLPGEGVDAASFGALLTNLNNDWAVYRMPLLIDFLTAEGALLAGTELQVTVLPGQTTAVSGQVFGAGSAFALQIVPPDDSSPYLPFASSGTIEVSDLATSSSETGLLITGTLTSSLTSDQTFLQLFAIYRNSLGDVIGGAPGAVESIASGGTVEFEISDTQPPPGVTSTEVYWQLGGQLPS